MVRDCFERRRTLAAHIHQLRIEANVTEAELADWLGCAEAQIGRLESYPDQLDIALLIDLAKAFGQDPINMFQTCVEILDGQPAR